MDRILVVGAGVFGVTAAIELRKRGHEVQLIDPGPLPHPLAAWTDISKVVRLEYGGDEAYTALAEQAGGGLWGGAVFRGLWRDRSGAGGIVTAMGERMEAAQIVFALGAWTPHALPWLQGELRSTGHPVFHLEPRDPDAYRPDRFP